VKGREKKNRETKEKGRKKQRVIEGETKEVKTKKEEEENVTENGRKERTIVRKERRRKNR
jgi:hypothetical protein